MKFYFHTHEKREPAYSVITGTHAWRFRRGANRIARNGLQYFAPQSAYLRTPVIRPHCPPRTCAIAIL